MVVVMVVVEVVVEEVVVGYSFPHLPGVLFVLLITVTRLQRSLPDPKLAIFDPSILAVVGGAINAFSGGLLNPAKLFQTVMAWSRGGLLLSVFLTQLYRETGPEPPHCQLERQDQGRRCRGRLFFSTSHLAPR